MASVVQICNRALQKLGAKRIVSLTEDSTNARACNVAYQSILDAELRAHPWSFAISRSSLAADSDEPEFGRTASYTLPSDFLYLLDDYPEYLINDKDWIIEGRKIYTNDSAPLNIRFVYRVTDPNLMDPLFQEALSAKMAAELCEELTQSNTKKADLKDDYKDAITRAKRTNAIEKISAESPLDTWITARE